MSPQAKAEGPKELDAVIVYPPGEEWATARKRRERLQEIPDAVAVFSQAVLYRLAVEDVVGVMARSPSANFSYNGNPLHAFTSIRGFGTFTPRAESSVGLFVDGVYQLGASQAFTQLFDVERVEVPRGPQTTLFGKSSTAGAVSIRSRRPGDHDGGYAILSAASDDLYRLTGAANGVLAEDRLFGRVAFDFRRFDGFFQSVAGEPLDDSSLAALRASLLAKPTEDLEIIPVVTWQRQTGGVFNHQKAASDGDYHRLRAARDHPSDTEVRNLLSSLTVNWDVSSQVRVTSITGFNHVEEEYRLDLDFSGVDPKLDLMLASEPRQDFSQELRVASSDDDAAFKWLGGLYAFYLDESFEQELHARNHPTLPAFTPSSSVRRSQTYSVFGQASYRFEALPLELGAGLRYDHDIRKQTDTRVDTTPWGRERFDSLSGQATASWFLLEEAEGACTDALLYAKFSAGSKAGGFNDGSLPPYGQEHVLAFEGGLKTSWLEGALTLNLTGFYMAAEDFQSFNFDNDTALIFTANDGRSRSTGAEFELRFAEGGLELGASFSYVNAVFTHQHSRDLSPAGPGEFSLDGNQLPYSPRDRISLYAGYRHELPQRLFDSKAALFGVVEAIYQGPISWDRFDVHKQSPYGLVNLRLGCELGMFKLEVFATNLLGEDYNQIFHPNFFFVAAGGSHLALPGAPRQVGFRLTATF